MGKKIETKNPALENYKFNGEYKAGVCGKCGLHYNLDTIEEQTIDAFIERGSDLFTKKTQAEKKDK